MEGRDTPTARMSRTERWCFGVAGLGFSVVGLVGAYGGRISSGRAGKSWEDPGAAAFIGGLFALVGAVSVIVAIRGHR